MLVTVTIDVAVAETTGVMIKVVVAYATPVALDVEAGAVKGRPSMLVTVTSSVVVGAGAVT